MHTQYSTHPQHSAQPCPVFPFRSRGGDPYGRAGFYYDDEVDDVGEEEEGEEEDAGEDYSPHTESGCGGRRGGARVRR